MLKMNLSRTSIFPKKPYFIFSQLILINFINQCFAAPSAPMSYVESGHQPRAHPPSPRLSYHHVGGPTHILELYRCLCRYQTLFVKVLTGNAFTTLRVGLPWPVVLEHFLENLWGCQQSLHCYLHTLRLLAHPGFLHHLYSQPLRFELGQSADFQLSVEVWANTVCICAALFAVFRSSMNHFFQGVQLQGSMCAFLF